MLHAQCMMLWVREPGKRERVYRHAGILSGSQATAYSALAPVRILFTTGESVGLRPVGARAVDLK